jgi:hypothetical protein
MRRATLLLVAMAAFVSACGEPPKKGDPVRGAKLHEVCLDCHGTGLYTKPDRKIKSRDALRQETARWGDYYQVARCPAPGNGTLGRLLQPRVIEAGRR